MYKTNFVGTSLLLLAAALAKANSGAPVVVANPAKAGAEKKSSESPVDSYVRMLLHPELGWKPRKTKDSESEPELSPSDDQIRKELKKMLATYAPRVWWHRKDPYPPTDPLEFIERSSLNFRGPSGKERVIAPVGHVRPEDLALVGGANPHSRPYQEGLALNGSGYFLRNEDPQNGARKLASFKSSPMFWRLGQGAFAQTLMHETAREGVDASKKRIVIEYWYHVPYNLATRIGIGNHQGDWEGIAMLIELEVKNGELSHRLLASFFSEHESGTWKCPSEVLRSPDDSHIEAFSASGTHATYPAPGPHRNNVLIDETERGIRWDSWENLKPLALEPYYGFSGAWGEPRFFSFMTGPLVPGPGYKPLPRESNEKDAFRTLATLMVRCGT